MNLADLRVANISRLPLFKNRLGEPAHTAANGSDWSILEWSGAMMGEVGELCEAVDMLIFSRDPDELYAAHVTEVGNEIADVVCYADILAFQLGIDLEDEWFRTVVHPSSAQICTLRATSAFGKVTDITKKLFRGDLTVAKGFAGVRDYLAQGFAYVGKLSRLCDLDPHEVTRKKWNDVSDRISLPLHISKEGKLWDTGANAPYVPVQTELAV